MLAVPTNYFILLMLIVMQACVYHPYVTRVDQNQSLDISGRFNDVDSKEVAQTLAEQILQSNWLSEHYQHNQQSPLMMFGQINNLTHEHIDTQMLIEQLKQQLLQCGQILIVSSGSIREQLRQEKLEQYYYASSQTQQRIGQEQAAQVLLTGDIHSIVDLDYQQKIIYYKVGLQLTDIEQHTQRWIGHSEIKKWVRR